MIMVVTTFFHDYEPYIEYIDTNKLDPNDYVDMEFLKAVKAGESACVIDASNWENYPEKFKSEDGDIGLSAKASVKKPKKIDDAIILRIDFDC